eukprot:6209218-Pleurochrysis_carterae.AAC.1
MQPPARNLMYTFFTFVDWDINGVNNFEISRVFLRAAYRRCQRALSRRWPRALCKTRSYNGVAPQGHARSCLQAAALSPSLPPTQPRCASAALPGLRFQPSQCSSPPPPVHYAIHHSIKEIHLEPLAAPPSLV